MNFWYWYCFDIISNNISNNITKNFVPILNFRSLFNRDLCDFSYQMKLNVLVGIKNWAKGGREDLIYIAIQHWGLNWEWAEWLVGGDWESSVEYNTPLHYNCSKLIGFFLVFRCFFLEGEQNSDLTININ